MMRWTLISVNTSNRDDAYKRHRGAWVLLQPRALSNKLRIRSVVSVGHPLVICEVSFRSPQGAERSKREKPWRSSIDSIAKVTYWPRFLPNAYEDRHNTSYRGAVDLRLHSYQDSSWAASRCQREKPKTVHTTSYKEALREKQLPCASQTLPRYKLSDRKPFQSFF